MKKFLIAKTIRHTVTTAFMDFNWTPDFEHKWKALNKEGDSVELIGVSDLIRKFRGYPLIGIYWGYQGLESASNEDLAYISIMVHCGRIKILERI